MKVKLRIDSQVTEDSVSIEARLMTESIKEIHRIYTENRQIRVRTAKDSYRAQQALYQLLQVLPDYFLQISQSEIINSRQISHLKLTPNGLIQIFLKNGDQTFSSRRYLKSIKERLQL